jgi:hypothetical protein
LFQISTEENGAPDERSHLGVPGRRHRSVEVLARERGLNDGAGELASLGDGIPLETHALDQDGGVGEPGHQKRQEGERAEPVPSTVDELHRLHTFLPRRLGIGRKRRPV